MLLKCATALLSTAQRIDSSRQIQHAARNKSAAVGPAVSRVSFAAVATRAAVVMDGPAGVHRNVAAITAQAAFACRDPVARELEKRRIWHPGRTPVRPELPH